MDRALINGPGAEWADEFLADGEWVAAHTSGSTGRPKEIRLLKSDMIASALATCRFFGIERESRLVCPLSTDYIAGKMMVVRALVSGARLELVKPSTSPLGEWHGEGRIALLPVVPSQVEALLADPKLAQVDNLLVGGGELSRADAQALTAAGINARSSYGMTETCSHVALKRVGEQEFTALPGVTFETDERGCLIINVPRMSVKRLVTNDQVRLTGPDRFVWLGRHDNVINSGGVKIHPEDDERLLAPYLGDTRFYITSRPSQKWGREAVMVVLDSAMTDEELLAACVAHLPRYHVPKAVIRDMQPQFTASGKLLRRKY